MNNKELKNVSYKIGFNSFINGESKSPENSIKLQEYLEKNRISHKNNIVKIAYLSWENGWYDGFLNENIEQDENIIISDTKNIINLIHPTSKKDNMGILLEDVLSI
jgi:hypothetical protein